MFEIRPFRNTDPPAVLEIWRSCHEQRGLHQPISSELLERYLFGRPYFDFDGLQIAWDGDRPLGLVHAGFGPNEKQDGLSYLAGTTYLLLTRPDCDDRDELADRLLESSEAYLKDRGCQVFYGGGIRPMDAFYLGLYGGSELPGILISDRVSLEAFKRRKYRDISGTIVFRGDLRTLQIPMTRQMMQTRRQMTVEKSVDPPQKTLWDAYVRGDFHITRFELHSRRGKECLGYAVLREMDLLDTFATTRNVGLMELWIEPEHRRKGLVTFLLSEIFHQLVRQGVAAVDVQTMRDNRAGVAFYRKLGFEEIDQGVVFRKDGPNG